MRKSTRAAWPVALAGIFCTAGCSTPAPTSAERPAVSAPPTTAAEPPATAAVTPPAAAAAAAASEFRVELTEPTGIVPVQPTSEPRYAAPESLKQFRFAQKNQPGAVLARKAAKRALPATTRSAAEAAGASGTPVDTETPAVVAVNAEGEAPRYKLPDSLKEWRPGRKVPLYEDPEAAPWQATPTEPRLQNAAVSCNYMDEGGVRGRVALLVDEHRVTRFTARIEMPNGGTCRFDSKQMEQRPLDQGIALQSKGDECVVRMWEQKHRITIAAYSCHKQCSKGSFSYLWPILMDTRIGTCY